MEYNGPSGLLFAMLYVAIVMAQFVIICIVD